MACDIPFLKKGLVETILDGIEPGVDIVIPETSKGLEPLCSVYSKHCLKPVEQQLVKQQLKIRQVFQKVRVKKLPEPILRKADGKQIRICFLFPTLTRRRIWPGPNILQLVQQRSSYGYNPYDRYN